MKLQQKTALIITGSILSLMVILKWGSTHLPLQRLWIDDYLMTLLGGFGLGFCGLSLFTLQKLVLSRLSRLTQEVTLISASYDLSQRVGSTGEDELSDLAHVLNRLISALERSQKELRRGQKKYQSVLNTVQEVIFQTDAAGVWTFLNPAWTRITGYSVGQSLGQSILTFVDPKDRRLTSESFLSLVQLKVKDCRYEARFLTIHQQVRWLALQAQLTYDERGEVNGIAGTLRDITDQKLAEDQQRIFYEKIERLNADLEIQVRDRTQQLRQLLDFEATLKRITDKVRDSLDENQILQIAIQELAEVLEATGCDTGIYDIPQKQSQIIHEYFDHQAYSHCHTATMDRMPELYQQLINGAFVQFCLTDWDPHNFRRNYHPLSVLACPIFDGHGVLGDLWLFKASDHIFNDLEIRLVEQVANQCAIGIRQARLYKTAQHEVEELEKLHHLKDDFLNTVSHELRTPMSNIKMSIHMLRQHLPEDRRQQYLRVMETECTREIELINDLLDLQRLEAGADRYHVTPIHLNLWIQEVVEPFYSRFQSFHQTFQLSLADPLPILTSDPLKVERILGELLNNACKYTGPEGEIQLAAQPAPVDGGVIFEISNQAEIPAEELPHIFEKFYRVPNADPYKRGGTGLGLALVKKLAEQLGGKISVISQEGLTTFTVELPALPCHSPVYLPSHGDPSTPFYPTHHSDLGHTA
ncbi:MAG: ATP-binding protein [Cyanobacteriota bacterium]|nr:ATP-binding protein [Cyanobacteriota bacterium]